MTPPTRPPDDNDDGRARGNWLGLAAAVLLIAAGTYVVIELIASIEYQKCAAAGRRNCDKVEPRDLPR